MCVPIWDTSPSGTRRCTRDCGLGMGPAVTVGLRGPRARATSTPRRPAPRGLRGRHKAIGDTRVSRPTARRRFPTRLFPRAAATQGRCLTEGNWGRKAIGDTRVARPTVRDVRQLGTHAFRGVQRVGHLGRPASRWPREDGGPGDKGGGKGGGVGGNDGDNTPPPSDDGGSRLACELLDHRIAELNVALWAQGHRRSSQR